MIYTEHQDAKSFLAIARGALESHECVHGLMLGICLRLVRDPQAYHAPPYLATVESAAGLRVAAVMTPPYKLLIYSEDDPGSEGIGLLVDALLRREGPVPGVMAQEAVAKAFASIWRRKTGEGSRKGMRLRIHELRQVEHPTYPSGKSRQAVAEDLELVQRWACGFQQDCLPGEQQEPIMRAAEENVKNGNLFLWVDDVPRSMAVRTRPTPHGEAIAFVYTPPEHRRRGYATAVVARLSQRLLDEGRKFCTLYTDLSNPTSNSIYGSIGYRSVADVIDVYFERGPDAMIRGGEVKMIKAVLWDNDGVLVDSEIVFFEVTRKAFARLGIKLTKEQWGTLYLGEGKSSREIARSLGANPAEIDPVIDERNKQHRIALRQPIAIRPQVPETLAALSRRVRMAMVTGSHREQLHLMHNSSNLLDFFELCITGDECHELKPNPAPYLAALEALGLDAKDCIAVEDSSRGLRSAMAAGIACVVVPTELTQMQDFSGALSVERDVSAVLKYIEPMNPGAAEPQPPENRRLGK